MPKTRHPPDWSLFTGERLVYLKCSAEDVVRAFISSRPDPHHVLKTQHVGPGSGLSSSSLLRRASGGRASAEFSSWWTGEARAGHLGRSRCMPVAHRGPWPAPRAVASSQSAGGRSCWVRRRSSGLQTPRPARARSCDATACLSRERVWDREGHGRPRRRPFKARHVTSASAALLSSAISSQLRQSVV